MSGENTQSQTVDSGRGRPVSRKMAGVLFADVRGYSKLTEPQLRRYFDLVLPKVASSVSDADPFYVNTWGDAVVAAFDDTRPAAFCALALRDLFRAFDWSGAEMPPLTLRCALHAGHLYTGFDPVSGQESIVGTQVVLAARVEPVIIPGHVWTTDAFVALLNEHDCPEIAFDSLGERPLAKEWGAKVLYRLRRSGESPDLPSLAEDDSTTRPSNNPLALCVRLVEIGTDDQRIAALDTLEQFDEPEALRVLIASAKNPMFSLGARRMAIASLAKLKNPIIVPELLDLLRDPGTPNDLIIKIVPLLGRLGDVRALDSLRDIAAAEPRAASTQIKEAAILALGLMKDSRAIDAIMEALTSDRTYLHKAAISALGAAWARGVRSSGDPTSALVDIAMRTENVEELRAAALEALSLIGPTQHQEALSELARDEDQPVEVRKKAILCLGMSEMPSAKHALEDIAADLSDPLAGDALRLMYKAKASAQKYMDEMKQM